MSESDRPVLYLDVDGPLNPWRSKGPHKHWPDYAKHTVKPSPLHPTSYRMWFSPSLGATIAGLCAHHGVELVWATTWGDNLDAIEDLANVGAGHRFLSPDTFDHSLRRCTKHLAVATDCETRPVVWIDDDLAGLDREWAKDRNADGYPTLLLAPSPSVGITEGDIGFISQWLGKTVMPTHK